MQLYKQVDSHVILDHVILNPRALMCCYNSPSSPDFRLSARPRSQSMLTAAGWVSGLCGPGFVPGGIRRGFHKCWKHTKISLHSVVLSSCHWKKGPDSLNHKNTMRHAPPSFCSLNEDLHCCLLRTKNRWNPSPNFITTNKKLILTISHNIMLILRRWGR